MLITIMENRVITLITQIMETENEFHGEQVSAE